jgi:hypothetical protein
VSDEKPAKAMAENLAKELKTSLAKDRPRTWKPVLALIGICSLILAMMLWWFLPRAQPPVLQVVAFDDVFTPDEKPIARGQLFAPPGVESALRLSGQQIAFDDQNHEASVKSDDKGQGTAEWPTENEEIAAFFVRFIDRNRRQGSAKESGRLYIWPKNAKIVLVDADETLTDAHDDAARVLDQAVENGWHIAYLALAGEKANDFRQARSRIDNLVKLPKGPYLGRRQYPAPPDSLESARREAVQSLRSKFKGQMVAVVQAADTAMALQGLGVRVIRIGDAATPGWAEVKIE